MFFRTNIRVVAIAVAANTLRAAAHLSAGHDAHNKWKWEWRRVDGGARPCGWHATQRSTPEQFRRGCQLPFPFPFPFPGPSVLSTVPPPADGAQPPVVRSVSAAGHGTRPRGPAHARPQDSAAARKHPQRDSVVQASFWRGHAGAWGDEAADALGAEHADRLFKIVLMDIYGARLHCCALSSICTHQANHKPFTRAHAQRTAVSKNVNLTNQPTS